MQQIDPARALVEIGILQLHNSMRADEITVLQAKLAELQKQYDELRQVHEELMLASRAALEKTPEARPEPFVPHNSPT